jgi:DNA-3-methyladenine glycosylase II
MLTHPQVSQLSYFSLPVNLIAPLFLPASCDTRRPSASSPALLHFGPPSGRPSTPVSNSALGPARYLHCITGHTNNFLADDRPVEPHTTSATLVTPGGTQVVAYPSNGWPDSSPSKTGLPKPTGTTGTILDQACDHLIRVDPKMKPLIEKHRCEIFSAKGLAEEIDPFRSLTTGIIGQQVSGAAANSIKTKFVGLFNEANPHNPVFPTPAAVAKTDISRLRLAGLSQRKAEYIQGLAEKFASGELSTAMLMKASDEEVMEKLIAVRGLGRWSVEMFACFGLKRMDVFSTGDLGVQRGMAAYMGKDVSKLKAKGGGKWKYMSEQDMLQYSAKFAPYRSLFMWYMWRVEDVDVSVMQND